MDEQGTIDEQRYSRQLYVLGVGGQQRIGSARVLIIGAGGNGAEIAKNLILAGIKHVTLQDTKLTTHLDLGGQCFLREDSSLGVNRAVASLPRLQKLNPSVEVAVHTEPIEAAFFNGFQIVVFTEALSESKLIEYELYCREANIGFIVSQADGVFSFVFVNHGADYKADNPRGIRPEPFFIKNLTKGDPAVLTLTERPTAMIGDDSSIKLLEVPGIPDLNNTIVQVWDVHSPTEFELDLDTTDYPPFDASEICGKAIQVINPLQIEFHSYQSALTEIKFEHVVKTDELHDGRDQQIIIGYAALRRVLNTHDSIQEVPFDEIVAIAREISESNPEEPILEEGVDELVLRELIRQFGFVIAPFASVIGGIVGQEVIKYITRQHTPINQFLALNCLEALPADTSFVPLNDRYDSYRAVFGNAQHSAMVNLRYFLVGAGAIGCEELKIAALMGVGTGPDGKIIVTDPDSIEQSNLSRQFLFRDSDIGKNKAVCAASAVLEINPELHIEAHMNRLDESTLSIYDRAFFESLSGVCNALDNVAARVLTDSLCCQYHKPLIDSGTEGPHGTFSPFIPRVTDHYAPPPEDPNQNIPSCTLHRHPTALAHTCVWAREIFQDLFHDAPQFIVDLATKPDFVDDFRANPPGAATRVLTAVLNELKHKPQTIAECAVWARVTFENLFVTKILDVLHEYEHTENFWTEGRRRPSPIAFNPEQEDHALFVVTLATIRARIWGIPIATADEILGIAANATLSEPQPQSEPTDEFESLLQQVIELRAEVEGVAVRPEEFEKDDESNGHMDFIATAANLRAINYQIEPVTRLEAKRIAGKIIPAMATTTAMVCGFVSIEMYKVHCVTPKGLEDYRNGSINLAFLRFTFSEPSPSKTLPLGGTEGQFHPVWEESEVSGDVAIEDFIHQVENENFVKVRSLNCNGLRLWSDSSSDDEEHREKKLIDVLKQVPNSPIRSSKRVKIAVDSCIPETDTDAYVPFYRVQCLG
jgi:ubiquitin-activating enzyme E1